MDLYIVYNVNTERSDTMAQTMVSFRMDDNLKKNMEETCKKMGITMTSAFTMFATKVTREQRIPFEITADPFYSEENMKRLEKIVKGIENGTIRLTEHELIDQ